ncbi:MAG TPA: cyclophane-forming radical SAM/SPASM peptide maturase GrrM/OscB [Trebonia sp.]|jgi:uncharacterized protein|nr:cyclophane-forming radical SAM/SPASM peptide maturase GrrM/OscB [Trebonia sp.]
MVADAHQAVHRPLVVLQPTTFCNIDCQYCYLPDRSSSRRMSVDVIRRMAAEVLGTRLFDGEIHFLWHLGEPLSVPTSFYEEAFSEIERISQAYGRKYVHTFQTNATLINDGWIALIKKHHVRIGVSLDGPAFIHDRERVTRRGTGTHAAVLKGVRLLQEHDVPFAVIAVLTNFTLDYPDEFFNFYREHGISRVGFNIDEIEGVHTSTSFIHQEAIARYKRFVARIIQLSDASGGAVRFREVWDNLRSIAMGADPYNLANKPLRILNFDVDGNFSTYCPELVAAKSERYGDFVMGNILTNGLEDLLTNPVFQLVNREVEEGLALCERTCPYWSYCGGGEPSSKFFQHGRFDVAETTTCRIHKQATVDVLVDYLEAKTARSNRGNP